MPARFVVVLKVLPVSNEVVTTSTSGTTAPWGSEITPLKVAPSVCAKAEPGDNVRRETERTTHTSQRRGILPPMTNVRMWIPSLYQLGFALAGIFEKTRKC